MKYVGLLILSAIITFFLLRNDHKRGLGLERFWKNVLVFIVITLLLSLIIPGALMFFGMRFNWFNI